MKSAILAIRIIGDATGAVAAMNKAQRAAMTFREKLGKAATVASAALGAIGVGAKQCVDAAADLQQSVGGVETVFGSSSAKMLQWSKDAAQAVGLSQNEYNTFATLVGSQLQNMGMSVDQSAVKTNELIGLGADLSSMFGGTTADAVDALSAALKGEMDPIEKYGISLNDAGLKAQAASMGLGDLYAAGDRNARMQTILAAITEQSGKAVGNFAREADTAQGQQQRMAAAFENSKAALGEALLPYLTMGAQKLAEFATWVQQNTTWLTPLAAVIAGVAAAIAVANAAMTAYSVVAALVAVAQGAVNLAFLPVVAIILAVVAVVILLASNWDTVKNIAMTAAQAIQYAWNTFVGWLAGIGAAIAAWAVATWNSVSAAFQPVVSILTGLFSFILAAFTGDFNGMQSAAQQVFNALPGPAQTAISMIGNIVHALVAATQGDFSGIQQIAQQVFDALPGWAQNAISSVVGFFQGMYDRVTGFFQGISDMISGAIGFVGSLIDKITGASNAAASMPSTPAAAYALQPAAYMMGRVIQPLATAGDIMARARATLPSRRSMYRAGASLARPAGRETVVTVNLTVESPIMTPGTAPEVGKQVYKALRGYFDTYGSRPL